MWASGFAQIQSAAGERLAKGSRPKVVRSALLDVTIVPWLCVMCPPAGRPMVCPTQSSGQRPFALPPAFAVFGSHPTPGARITSLDYS